MKQTVALYFSDRTKFDIHVVFTREWIYILVFISSVLSVAGVVGCDLISKYRDICASFQWAVLKHMARTLQRALLFCDMKQLLPDCKTLVRWPSHSMVKSCQ